MPRDEEKAGSATPATAAVEAELAAYRNRIEEKLAARRAGTRMGAALGGAQRPVATGATAGTAAASSLLARAAVVSALGAGLVGTGVLAWPLLPDRPALVEAREALVLERGRNQQLADELRAASLALKAQALASADHAAREAQIEQLREELKQAGEIAVMRDHFLAQAQERLRQLQMPPEPVAAPPVVEAQVATPRVPPVAAPILPITVALAAPVEPSPPPPQPEGDLPKLMARARLLLGQGDIGGARAILERAAASGNAVALFALAETFDPAILSTWGTHGTRGDVARAHTLYEQAYAAGVAAAAERLAVLR